MFEVIRKYAPMVLIVLMSVFVVALAMDEYNDSRRIAEDLRIESCVELETEDYEWDEGQVQQLSPTLSQGEGFSPLAGDGREVFGGPAPCISDKQKLGLVRRYAPRKGFARYNYART